MHTDKLCHIVYIYTPKFLLFSMNDLEKKFQVNSNKLISFYKL